MKKTLIPNFSVLFPCDAISLWKQVTAKLYINLLVKLLCRVDTTFKSAGEVLDV